MTLSVVVFTFSSIKLRWVVSIIRSQWTNVLNREKSPQDGTNDCWQTTGLANCTAETKNHDELEKNKPSVKLFLRKSLKKDGRKPVSNYDIFPQTAKIKVTALKITQLCDRFWNTVSIITVAVVNAMHLKRSVVMIISAANHALNSRRSVSFPSKS